MLQIFPQQPREYDDWRWHGSEMFHGAPLWDILCADNSSQKGISIGFGN